MVFYFCVQFPYLIYQYYCKLEISVRNGKENIMRSLIKFVIKMVPVVAIAIAVMGIVHTWSADHEKNEEAAVYEKQAEEIMISSNNTEIIGNTDMKETYEYPAMDLSMYSDLEDFVGVIYIPAADILYPIMSGEEYSRLDINRESSKCGSIYTLDDFDINAKHNFIFGHNMANGSMFGNLKETFLDGQNIGTLVYLYTMDDVHCYKVTNTEVRQAGEIATSYGESDSRSITLYTCYGMAGQKGKHAKKLLVNATEVFCTNY